VRQARRQVERHVAARQFVTAVLLCGTLFHLSRADLKGAVVPTIIATVVWFLKAEHGCYVLYFIDLVAFNSLCYLRGGGPHEGFLWSPVLMLPLWNMMAITSVTTHAALELWRFAAVLRFCQITELRMVVGSLIFLMAAWRVVEANHDLTLIGERSHRSSRSAPKVVPRLVSLRAARRRRPLPPTERPSPHITLPKG
jgi:hypothetical protein